ncbi:DUF2027 domain-containing protein, partial [Desulfosarcina sp.]|nr:DUF2027 domain-containing protein [Desulfosarcina sp.]
KVGDRVKFLNESGGGIVSKVISPNMVNVAIEDGFEIPTMNHELLKIELEAPVDSPKHFFREEYNVEINSTPQTIEEEDERNVPLLNYAAKGIVEPGIYLAFLPHDQKWLITGMIDVYLVNHTKYDILYSVFLEDEEKGFTGFDYGSVIPDSMILMESIEREEISKWEKGMVQVLFHNDTARKILAPGNSNFKIKTTRFYKETSYKDSAIIDGKSVLVSLMSISAQTTLFTSDDAMQHEKEETIVTEAKTVEPEHIIEKHKTSPREAVVDLHIGELVEDSEKLESSEALRLQINYFSRCLESAIANNLSKVTFIHGVGTGVLKTTIKQVLKDYANCNYQDGSMKEFGYGAMDVLIRNS